MRLHVNKLEIISSYGELIIEDDIEQECIHLWFIPINAKVEVDGNHIKIIPHNKPLDLTQDKPCSKQNRERASQLNVGGDMSTNCINCLKNKRTGTDLLCDNCRKSESKPDTTIADELRSIAKEIVRIEPFGFERSQYCSIRLRLIADEIERLQQANSADTKSYGDFPSEEAYFDYIRKTDKIL